MVEEGAIFRGDSCDGNDTLGTDALSKTTLIYGVELGEKNVYCALSFYGNVGGGRLGKLEINSINGCHPYRTHESGTNMVT